MLRGLIVALLLTGCTTVKPVVVEPEQKTPGFIFRNKYNIGDCVYLVDPGNNYRGNKKDAMKIEDITPTHYVYRWSVPDFINKKLVWAIGSNEMPHAKFERLTKRLDKCPF